MIPVLAYWDIRGRTTPIRLLLSFAGVNYTYKEYTADKMKEWFEQDKIKLEETLAFPNLPYYVDDNVKLTQANTILAYLGRKHGLDGESEEEKLRMSSILEQIRDMTVAIAGIAYPPSSTQNLEEVQHVLRKEYSDSVPVRLGRISKFLGNFEWVAGDRLTYPDFCFYDMLDIHRSIFSSADLSPFSNLGAYMARVEGLPRVGHFIRTKVDKIPNKDPKYERYAILYNDPKN